MGWQEVFERVIAAVTMGQYMIGLPRGILNFTSTNVATPISFSENMLAR